MVDGEERDDFSLTEVLDHPLEVVQLEELLSLLGLGSLFISFLVFVEAEDDIGDHDNDLGLGIALQIHLQQLVEKFLELESQVFSLHYFVGDDCEDGQENVQESLFVSELGKVALKKVLHQLHIDLFVLHDEIHILVHYLQQMSCAPV